MSEDIRTEQVAAPQYQVLRVVPKYDEAQRIVDHLADSKFPVEHVRIVGTGLRWVEQVTGRMTYGKAALLGAAAGAWFGLLLGLLIGIFVVVGWLAVILWSVILGAVWGLVFGLLGHAVSGGRRDFSSVKGIEASSYEILVDARFLNEAAAKVDR